MGSNVNSDLKTTPLTSDPPDSINDTVSNIAAYLGNLAYPKASLSPTSFTFNSISVGLTATQTFTVSNLNSRGPLTVGTVSISDNTNYSLNNGCTAAVGVGSSCSIVVTFRPQSFGVPLNATLTVNHNALGGSSTASISGTGLAPFTVAPTAPLTFTPATAPTGLTRTVTISDNKGDSIQVCRVDAPAFNAPTDFTLESPGAFDSNACFTQAAGAAPRTISLVVRFIPGAPGPRNANLAIQRLTSCAAPAPCTVTTVQLQGNPGPFATVNASSLFDAPGDPGVEVDNDNTLTRTVTLFSEGSDPIVFNGSSFTIGGPSAGEYALAGTGCQTLAQLAPLSGGTPPSCVLTVIFNPSDVNRRGPATLTIQAAGTNTNAVSLNGLGFRGPRLAVRRGVTPLVSGDIVQFGAQTINGLYPTIPVTLTNGGTLGDLDVILPAAGSVAGFTFTGTGCAQLAPAASCTLALHFDPTAEQAYASAFVIQTRPTGTSDPVKLFQLDLRGQGTASAVPVLSWTDTTGTPITSIAFPDTDLGSPSTTNIRLYNDGPGGVNLQFANVVGIDSPHFVIDSSGCPSGTNLFEKTSCQIVVQFAPGTAGPKAASIQLAANLGSPSMLVVAPLLAASGTAIGSAAPATLLLSSATLQFVDTVAGTAAAPMELRLQNTGTRSLSVQSLQVGAPFVVTPKSCASVPFLLSPGNECSVTVSFAPQSEGNATGTLMITTDASATPQQVALSGRAEPKADLSSGGCSMASGDSATDPTLWALVLLAAAVLIYRRRAQRRGQTRRPPT